MYVFIEGMGRFCVHQRNGPISVEKYKKASYLKAFLWIWAKPFVRRGQRGGVGGGWHLTRSHLGRARGLTKLESWYMTVLNGSLRTRVNTGELGNDGLNGTRKICPSYAKSVIYIWHILYMHGTRTEHIVRHRQTSVVQWSVISKFTCVSMTK